MNETGEPDTGIPLETILGNNFSAMVQIICLMCHTILSLVYDSLEPLMYDTIVSNV